MSKLTLKQFQLDPEAVAEQVFGENGLLSNHIPDFRPNDKQREYARLVARAAVRGLDAETVGRLTLLNAATGIGKTLPYTVIGLLAAVLTGKRFMVATYTRALMHQLVGKDGRIACAIVHDLTGKLPTIAPRRSRSGFASPSRASEYAGSIRQAQPQYAAALDALADFTQSAIDELAEGRGKSVLEDLGGLPESFAAENPDDWAKILELPTDKWRLTAVSPESEQDLWRFYGHAAAKADGIVVTHAAALIDQSLHGRILDRVERGYALVVIDEAHALERAAALAFQTRRSVSEIVRDAMDMRDRLADEWFSKSPDREETKRLANLLSARASRLVEKLKADMKAHPSDETRFDVHGGEPWIKSFVSTLQSVKLLARHLKKYKKLEIVESAEDFDARMSDMDFFWACIRYKRRQAKKAERKNIRIPKGLFRPQVLLTPKREDPNFLVMPTRGQRVISRLWWRGHVEDHVSDAIEKPIKANAVIFTSATLGYPGKDDWASFETMVWTLGIDDNDKALINRDLCRTLEPNKFGDARFIFPSPSAPLPNDHGDGDSISGISDDSARYAAFGIEHVANTPNLKRGGSCRILVLTSNSADPGRIAAFLPKKIQERCIIRRPGMMLRTSAEQFRQSHDGIFLTYGAWEGLDLPDTIDYLVIPRLPFTPPPEEEDGAREYGGPLLGMMRTLRQGLGRALRKDTDSVVYVFTDPRIGLPEDVATAHMEVPHAKSNPVYLGAIPRRFRNRMNEAEVLPPLPGAEPQSRVKKRSIVRA